MYEAVLTDDYYINAKADDGSMVLEWAEVPPHQEHWQHSHSLGEAETLEGAKKLIYDAGHLQDVYPACFVYHKEKGEVYSSVPALYKCDCCKREEWERIEETLA